MNKLLPAILIGIIFVGCKSVAYKERFDRVEPKGATVNAPFDVMIANAEQPALHIGTVYFPFDDATLSDKEKQHIRLMANAINLQKGVIVVEGHASYENSKEFNQTLGYKRSLAVAKYLYEAGVWEERLHVKSFGKSRPIADNHNAAARAENRRVEVKMLAQGGSLSGKEAEKIQKSMFAEEKEPQANPMMNLMSLMGGSEGGGLGL